MSEIEFVVFLTAKDVGVVHESCHSMNHVGFMAGSPLASGLRPAPHVVQGYYTLN